ncbi:hypothetical protein LCGC14_0343220 [marine sediment metagenome]|uniref:Uncharacterized protein n=1 Tax=marine sediment metagenome TaxID=412755 RepID=A0A0F9TIP4_9ZZZZ
MALSYRQWFNENMGHMVGSTNIQHVQQQWRAYQKRNKPAPTPVARAAAPAPVAAPASAAALDLQGSQDAFIKSQNAMIDRNAERGAEQGLSNMISSGLSGTTAVGGMNAAVAETAGLQKANVAAGAQRQTDQLRLGYSQLASSDYNQGQNRAQGASQFTAGQAQQASQFQQNQQFAQQQAAYKRQQFQQDLRFKQQQATAPAGTSASAAAGQLMQRPVVG